MRDIADYTNNYIEHPFEDIQAKYRKKKIVELIKKYKHKQILEVGCGLDPFFNCFDDFEKLVIIEPSIHFYENAKNISENDPALKSKVVVINNYLEHSRNELSKYNFDFILVSGLLHEIENVHALLDELYLLFNNDTTAHINVPNANSFHRLLALEMGLIKSVFEFSSSNVSLQQNSVFDMNSLSELITTHHYKIINSGSYFIKPFTHNQMFGLVDNKIIDNKVLDGLYNMSKHLPNLGSEIFIEFKLND